MKITKKQLRQIIEEEVSKALDENAMKERAVLSVWEEYEKGTASLPEVRHPDGLKREERACVRRTENRLAKGKDKDCWWCAETDSLTTSKPKKGTC